MHRKQNFKIALALKVTRTSVLAPSFRFLFSHRLPFFLPYFLSSAVHLVVFILMGKVFVKAFRILGLDERKGKWVVEFLWKFSGQC